MGRHTILLYQPAGTASRTYFDFPNTVGAYQEVITLYEKQLKQMNPHTKHITYDIQNLMNFIDSLPDLGALALDGQTGHYQPYGKDWIKKGIYELLHKQAGTR